MGTFLFGFSSKVCRPVVEDMSTVVYSKSVGGGVQEDGFTVTPLPSVRRPPFDTERGSTDGAVKAETTPETVKPFTPESRVSQSTRLRTKDRTRTSALQIFGVR